MPGPFAFSTSVLFLDNALDPYRIGLEEVCDRISSIFFGTVLFARFDERDCIIRG